MKRVHYTDSYLMSPQHPVTVNLIGAGGTGSQVLTCLARLDTALRGLGHPGLFVTLYDPDTVTEATSVASFSDRPTWDRTRHNASSPG